jgi:hypothetical protein
MQFSTGRSVLPWGRQVVGDLVTSRFLPAVGLTTVELWLQFVQFALDCGEVVHRGEGVGVVVA